MTITIVGAGAIGGLLGAYLSASGTDVLLVDHDEDHVRAIERDGLTVLGVRGRLTTRPRVARPTDLTEPLGPVLLAVKAQHTTAALRGIEPWLRDDTFVVSLQNEFNEDAIAEVVGAHRTVGGLPDYGGALIEPGVLEFTSEAPLYLGELDGRSSDRVTNLANTCRAFIDTVVTDNILGRVWSKNVYLLQHKLGFAASTDDDRDDLYTDPGFQRAAAALVREGLAMARRHNITVPAGQYFDPTMYADDVAEATTAAHIEASYGLLMAGRQRLRGEGHRVRKVGGDLWWDIVHKRRTSETTATRAAFLERGRSVGIEPALASSLLQQIAEIESGDRERGRHNLTEFLNALEQSPGALAQGERSARPKHSRSQ